MLCIAAVLGYSFQHHCRQQMLSLLQVGSLLIGGASILKTAAEQKGVIEHYEQMVNELQDPNLSSNYVTIVDPGPHAPTDEMHCVLFR